MACIGRHVIQEAVHGREDGNDLLLETQRHILVLLENFDHALAARQLRLGSGVEFATELREGRHFTVLRQVETQPPGHLFHGPCLGCAADARHRQADVDRRAHAGVEQIGFEIDLAVGNGNDVGRDIGRHVTGLGFDDRQRRQGTAAVVVAELGGAFQQAGVQVENVTRVGFASGRPAQQQRKLTVGRGLLGEIVVDA